MSGLNGRAKATVILSAALVALAVLLGAARLWSYIGDRSATDHKLTAIADYLVDCTTPTPTPTPDHPKPRVHECFERGARGQSGAIVELDCRSRRQQARMVAPPDPTRPCVDQTPPDIYPGVAGQPTK